MLTLTFDEELTTGQMAELFGVTDRTIERWADRGILPAIRLTPTSPRRFRLEDVESLLEEAQRGGEAA